MTFAVNSLRYPFAIDAGLGRLAVETDYAEYVDQLIKQVLFTNPGERVNRPDFGCGLRRMIFAPNSEANASLLQVMVFEALETWLSEVIELDEVEVTPKEETLEVHIAYLMISRQERRYLNIEVTL
jgi:phage baseplate assembly protein W